MSQVSNQMAKSFTANGSVSAYTVVQRMATSTMAVGPWNTATAFIAGVAANNASVGEAVQVIIGGTAKVYCSASVPAGSLVGPNTVTSNLTGGIGAVGALVGSFTSTVAYRALGIALENGSTNSVIEVLLHVNNVSGV